MPSLLQIPVAMCTYRANGIHRCALWSDLSEAIEFCTKGAQQYAPVQLFRPEGGNWIAVPASEYGQLLASVEF